MQITNPKEEHTRDGASRKEMTPTDAIGLTKAGQVLSLGTHVPPLKRHRSPKHRPPCHPTDHGNHLAPEARASPTITATPTT